MNTNNILNEQKNVVAIQDLFQTLQQAIASVQSLIFVLSDSDVEDYQPEVLNDYLYAVSYLSTHAQNTCEKLINAHQQNQIHSTPIYLELTED